MKIKKYTKYILPLLFFLTILLVIISLNIHFIKIKAINLNDNIIYIMLYVYMITVVSCIINISVHEAGHLIFGLITGYKFLSFRVFSFMLVKINGRFKITRYSIAGTGGQCLMIPPKESKDYPYLLYNLGGIIIGVIFGIFCLSISFFVQDILYMLFVNLAAYAFVFVVFNGIPFKDIVQNDAQNIVDLLKSEDNRKIFYIELKVEQALTDGLTMKDLPEEWFELEVPCENSAFGMTNEMIKYYRIFSKGDYKSAEKLNDYLRSINTLPIFKNLLLVDKIFMMLLRDENIDDIKRLITRQFLQILRTMKYESSVLRTKYAIEKYVNKNDKEANKVMLHFNKLEKYCHKIGEYKHEKMLIELLDNKKIEN